MIAKMEIDSDTYIDECQPYLSFELCMARCRNKRQWVWLGTIGGFDAMNVSEQMLALSFVQEQLKSRGSRASYPCQRLWNHALSIRAP